MQGEALSDSASFISGALFTTDYLADAIKHTEAYRSVDAAGLRARLAEIAVPFPKSIRTNESQTEDDFIWPVLGALGWSDSLRQQNLTASGRDDVPDGLLFADAASKLAANAQVEQWRRYAHGLCVVECKRWARPLDRASGKDETTAPSTQMLRYLRRIDDLTAGRLRWGILTNGSRWRLYWAGARSVSEQFLEIDLSRVLALDGADLFASDADREHWLRVFAVLFSREAFLGTGVDRRTFHERARADAAFYEEKVASSLSELVFTTVFPNLASAIAEAAPDAPLTEVRDAALVLLYRLLFLLYAEDRALLPVNDKRYDDYALRNLRLDVGRRVSNGDAFSTSATRIFGHVADLARIIDRGDTSVGIPPYNGGLFATEGAPLLARVSIGDAVMAGALDAISFERSTGERRYINYRDLSVQQLGSIYERLLEFELFRGDGGTLSVRPNLFARKNSGSYYTPDDLVGLILSETLEPLISERLAAFHAALNKLDPEESELVRRRELREVDPAEAILRLRICDPAMGSGHFLVSLVDMLADHVLDAMAEAAAQGRSLGYVSPLAEKIEDIRTTILRNARAAKWAIDEAQLDDRHIVRRMVLKRCIYGVDKNPMAVELAKVALWLHTFTVGAPLSFIDHHLRAGDSLFGLWVRDAIDKAAAWGGGELLYVKELKEAQSAAAAMQLIERAVDVEIAEAHQSAATFFGIKAQVGPLDAFVSLLHALDWLDLKAREDKAAVRAWLDGQFGNPIEIALGRARPIRDRARREEGERFSAVLERAHALIAEERFLNWQIAFPGVWSNWEEREREGGFDAVVGNPPWDRIKLQQVEWFAARRPDIASEPRAADRKQRVDELVESGDPLASEFLIAEQRANDMLRMARHSSGKSLKKTESGKRTAAPSDHYPLLSGGDINLYSLFVERAHALVKSNGMVGLLVPIGIGADKTSADYISNITENQQLKAFLAFENKRRWLFKDVHAEDQPTIIVSSNPGRRYSRFRYAVKLHVMPNEKSDPTVMMDAETLKAVNPNTGTVPIFRSAEDARLVSAAYARTPVFVRKSGQGDQCDWNTRYLTMFHMTNDSKLFRDKKELENEEGAWYIGNQRFQSSNGVWLPLYEGKSVQIYNHRYASIVTPVGSISGQGQAIHSTLDELASPEFLPTPRYWVSASKVDAIRRGYAIGFNDVCNTNNARSLIAAIVPHVAAGNKLPILDGLDAPEAALLIGNLNSIPCDYFARNKIQSRNLNKYILEQLPILPPVAYARNFGPKSAAAIVRDAVLELTYTAHDIALFARDMGHVDASGAVLPPFRWNEGRRLKLRAKLDALYFILYGLFDSASPAQSRDDIRYIFSTFPIVERDEVAKYGQYRSRDLALAWINALLAGQPDAEIE